MLRVLAEKKQRRAPSPSSRRPARGRKRAARTRTVALLLPAAAAVALVLFLISGLFQQSWMGVSVVRAATLDQVDGPVEILPAGGDTWQAAATDEPVEAGDRIRTGPRGSAAVAFFDGSAAVLEAETEITVVQMSSRRDGSETVTVLHQWVGRTYSRVQRLLDPGSRFEIETPTAVTAVRSFTQGVGCCLDTQDR